MRKKLGLDALPKPPAKPLASKSKLSILKKIPRWVYVFVGVFGLLITLLEAYPWLSVQIDDSLDLHDPSKTLFSVINEGYIPIANVSATCVIGYKASTPHMDADVRDNLLDIPVFASWLNHAGRATIPCMEYYDRALYTPTIEPFTFQGGATLKLIVNYHFFHLDFDIFARHQTFKFQTVLGPDKSSHWEYK